MDDQNVTIQKETVGFKEGIFHEYRGVIIAATVLVIVGIVFGVSALVSKKTLSLTLEDKKFSLTAGQPFTITWKASGMSRVGIALYKDGQPSWIAKDVPAKSGAYNWTVFEYQEPSSDYTIAVFEYPWKGGNRIAYSGQPVEIIGPRYASCDALSIENEWPYVPSGYVGMKRVFVTAADYDGNLGGLEGADKKCQQAADKAGYAGAYYAFLGDDKTSAQERLKSDGVFVLAEAAITLKEGRTCHRLLAENGNRLMEKFSLTANIAAVKIDDKFYQLFTKVWVGRIAQFAKRECAPVGGTGASSYTYTTTCQNWSTAKEKIYEGTVPDYVGIERCYDETGKSIAANYLGAFATASSNGDIVLQTKTCAGKMHLLCLEQ